MEGKSEDDERGNGGSSSAIVSPFRRRHMAGPTAPFEPLGPRNETRLETGETRAAPRWRERTRDESLAACGRRGNDVQ
jgi:hypothetical protein